MAVKNKWGVSSAPVCFFCKRVAGITKNAEGVTCCTACKNKKADILCPICKSPVDIRSGKYGNFFFCWSCNKNWSSAQIQRWNK